MLSTYYKMTFKVLIDGLQRAIYVTSRCFPEGEFLFFFRQINNPMNKKPYTISLYHQIQPDPNFLPFSISRFIFQLRCFY